MTPEQIRTQLRNDYNIDIEISAVYTSAPETNFRMQKIGYRFLITRWNLNNMHEHNIYSKGVFKNYEAALQGAINSIKEEFNIEITSEKTYNYVD